MFLLGYISYWCTLAGAERSCIGDYVPVDSYEDCWHSSLQPAIEQLSPRTRLTAPLNGEREAK